MRIPILSAIFLVSASTLFCQDTINFDDIFWPFDVVRKEMNQSGPFKAVETLTNVDKDLIKEPDFYGQALMTAYCFCGAIKEKDEACQTYRIQKPTLTKSEILSENIYPEDAKLFILEQAKAHPVTMINEAHLYPQHRLLFKSLLKDLYEMGYKHLCIEDLARQDYSNLKYPVSTMGFYINEPIMGDVVREALKIGYRLYAYDAPGETNRDSVAAGNIYNIYQTCAEKQSEKVLVYCGFAHNMESRKKSMASYFKNISNIDPLTVNQTTYYEAEPSPFYKELVDFYNIQQPSVLVTEAGEAVKMNKTFCDITVISPYTNYYKGRPDWLINIDKRKEIAIDPGFHEGVIEVYYKEEINDPDAIPVERLRIRQNNLPQHTSVLLLPQEHSFVCKYFNPDYTLQYSIDIE